MKSPRVAKAPDPLNYIERRSWRCWVVFFAGNVHSIENTVKDARITLWKLTRRLKPKIVAPDRLDRIGDESFDLLDKLEGGEPQPIVKTGLICPDCGDNMSLKNGKFGLFYGCDTYKKTGCRGSVSADKHGEPLSFPVDAATRRARYVIKKAADEVYDQEGLVLDHDNLRTYDLKNCQELLDRLIKKYPLLEKFVEDLPVNYQQTRWERLMSDKDPLDTVVGAAGVKRRRQ